MQYKYLLVCTENIDIALEQSVSVSLCGNPVDELQELYEEAKNELFEELEEEEKQEVLYMDDFDLEDFLHDHGIQYSEGDSLTIDKGSEACRYEIVPFTDRVTGERIKVAIVKEKEI